MLLLILFYSNYLGTKDFVKNKKVLFYDFCLYLSNFIVSFKSNNTDNSSPIAY